MHPWYKGYSGIIEQQVGGKYLVTGRYSITHGDETEDGIDQLHITELPIGKWTRDYKNMLEELAQTDFIEEIRE